MPLTLRVIFHGIRSAWVGLMIMVIGWIGFVPATPVERSALRSPIGVERPAGLIPMRIARAMVHFAPDRAARLLSEASDGEISPELAGMMLRQIAKGNPADQTDTTINNRGINGPKFITVD
ncbi:hypothetical protein [Loktanella sp. S4079]|uniref:hypothetical protein n=1 Tax=Loktanella sp. S4079 TaxID=579483 RepID=UPI0005FA883C|nr:hypothetical protein [Loktanella sp. S4079]KJZ20704.1 hypothetical protein TW80_08045 [Loktanella sp. S4079]